MFCYLNSLENPHSIVVFLILFRENLANNWNSKHYSVIVAIP